MLIRGAVAAIDFNANVNRKEKKNSDGKDMYKTKVNLIY